MNERECAFKNLIRPLVWSDSSSIEYRRNLVLKRLREIHLVQPFLTVSERIEVQDWLKENKHEGLWE